jgi:hypothetical protein
MKFISRFIYIVSETSFKKYYNRTGITISYDKFKSIPAYLQLTIINSYLTIKFGIFIYYTLKGIYISKIKLDHESPRELLLNGNDVDTGIIASYKYEKPHIIPTDNDIIEVFNKIAYMLTEEPFKSLNDDLEW